MSDAMSIEEIWADYTYRNTPAGLVKVPEGLPGVRPLRYAGRSSVGVNWVLATLHPDLGLIVLVEDNEVVE